MNAQQWETLVAAVRGEDLHPLPTAFIVDSPWMAKWAVLTILDYYTDDRVPGRLPLNPGRFAPSCLLCED